MNRFTSRPLAATLILAAATLLTQAYAGEAAEGAAPKIDAPPPKPYVIESKRIKDYVRAAVEDPTRNPGMTIHDAYRKPAELFDLANIKPNHTVVEFSSYGNYWSTMLHHIVGEKGELRLYDHEFVGEGFAKQGAEFAAAHKNTTYQQIDHNKIEFERGIDLVWCYACYHELLLTNTTLTPFQSKLYKAMKPGSVLIVVFYKARDGTETDDVGTLHRIDQSIVRAQLQSAGFTLEGEEIFLQNLNDDRTTQVFTETEADLADRVVFRFRRN